MAGSETSREAVRRVLSGGRAGFLPFMPWVCSHAAKLEQVALRDMLNDPALLTRALENAQRLYGYDMVVNIFDTTIEAEACGCPVKWGNDRDLPVVDTHSSIDHLSDDYISNIANKGRLPVVIEATKRLKITLGRTVAVAGVVTGPFTLASHLKGENIAVAMDSDPDTAEGVVELAGKICLEVCKSYCELEVDVIVLADSVMPQLSEKYFPLALSVLGPMVNVIRFYDGSTLLLAGGCTGDSLGLLSSLETDGMVVDGGIEAELRERESRLIVGLTIPSSLIEGPKEPLIAHIDHGLNKGGAYSFISTEWEVPYDTPPENIHRLMKHIKEV